MGLFDHYLSRNRGCTHQWSEWEEKKDFRGPPPVGISDGVPYIAVRYVRQRWCEKCGEEQKEKSREKRAYFETRDTEEIIYD